MPRTLTETASTHLDNLIERQNDLAAIKELGRAILKQNPSYMLQEAKRRHWAGRPIDMRQVAEHCWVDPETGETYIPKRAADVVNYDSDGTQAVETVFSQEVAKIPTVSALARTALTNAQLEMIHASVDQQYKAIYET